jgi:membrane associated rhomboid family serine protease
MGRFWQLFTSALVFAGIVAPQVVLIVVLGLVTLRLTGARVFWLIVLIGHVGCTLIVYVGLWTWSALRHVALTQLPTAPDYGTSLIWCALLGALAAIAWRGLPSTRHGRRLRLVVASGAVVLIAGMAAFSDPIARYEHILAICSGAFVVGLAWRPPSSRYASTGTLGDHD